MREIKFRAWDTLFKQWKRFEETARAVEYAIMYSQLDDIKLMQYTGLKDKNGVEIYEGDIVKRLPLFTGDDTDIRNVHWNEGWGEFYPFGSGDLAFTDSLDKVEVIGNIYENPELLK